MTQFLGGAPQSLLLFSLAFFGLFSCVLSHGCLVFLTEGQMASIWQVVGCMWQVVGIIWDLIWYLPPGKIWAFSQLAAGTFTIIQFHTWFEGGIQSLWETINIWVTLIPRMGALHSPHPECRWTRRLSCPLVGTGLQDLSPPLKGWQELLIPLICFFFFFELVNISGKTGPASILPLPLRFFTANSLLAVFFLGSLSRFSSFVFSFSF